MKCMLLSRTETQVADHKHTHNLYHVVLHVTILAGFELGFFPSC